MTNPGASYEINLSGPERRQLEYNSSGTNAVWKFNELTMSVLMLRHELVLLTCLSMSFQRQFRDMWIQSDMAITSRSVKTITKTTDGSLNK